MPHVRCCISIGVYYLVYTTGTSYYRGEVSISFIRTASSNRSINIQYYYRFYEVSVIFSRSQRSFTGLSSGTLPSKA